MRTLPQTERRRLGYVPLAAAGVQVLLGLMFLGRLTGLLWHASDVRTFTWWVPLDPSVLGPTWDWLVWGCCFLISVAPSILKFSARNIRRDTVVLLTSFIFPCLSLVVLSVSYYVGATLLVGSGFLTAYVLLSRSESLLSMERGSAVRLVLTEVFAFLTVAAAGGVVSILLWQDIAFPALVFGYDSTDVWLSLLKVDMESFYLARPILLAAFAALAVAAIIALFREPLWCLTRLMTGRVRKRKTTAVAPMSAPTRQGSGTIALSRLFPYLILAGSVALGISIAIYPYTVGKVRVVLGSDVWFYMERLRVMMAAPNPFLVLEADRGLFVLTLFIIMSLAHLDVESVLMLAPALCSVLLAVSVFALVKEGTGRPWLAGFAALLSVVSAQTNLGMSAGILANWFSLSLLNFMFALMLRWIRLRSKLAGVGSLLVSLVLLGSYTYTWVAAVVMLAVALVATIFSFRRATRDPWGRELISYGAVLVGVFALPVALGYVVVIPLLGYVPSWFNPFAWASMGSSYLVGRPFSEALALAPSAFEEAFDFAGNRVDLPFLTILSIVGLADSAWSGSFRRLVAAMVLVPIVLAAVSPNLYLTWRGLYMIPMYLTGALGVGSIIDRVNGQGAPWRSLSRLAFAGTFAGYVFLAHLSYSMRALELLIMVTQG